MRTQQIYLNSVIERENWILSITNFRFQSTFLIPFLSIKIYKRLISLFQTLKNERYRLKVVVDELQNAEAVDYQTVILAFINCLIISTPQLNDRIRIRNEFIGK